MKRDWNGKADKVENWTVTFQLLDRGWPKLIRCCVSLGDVEMSMELTHCLGITDLPPYGNLQAFRQYRVLDFCEQLEEGLKPVLSGAGPGALYKFRRKYVKQAFLFFKDELGDCKEHPDTNPEWLRGWSTIAKQLFPKSDPMTMLAFSEEKDF